MGMALQSIRHIICLQFCISTPHPYFHPASLFLLTNFHPASRHFPPSIPAKNTTLVSYLLRHITSSLAVNRDKLTNFVRIPDQICLKQAQCCHLACHKIATYRAPPCLMLDGIPPASLSEGWKWNMCWTRQTKSKPSTVATHMLSTYHKIICPQCGDVLYDRWISSQRANDAESISTSLRHHARVIILQGDWFWRSHPDENGVIHKSLRQFLLEHWQWRHNARDAVSNHQPHDCLLNRLFRHRRHQSSASLALVKGMHRWPVISPHKWPVTQKMFPFNDVIMTMDNSGI